MLLTCRVTRGLDMGIVHAADATGVTLCHVRFGFRYQGQVWEGEPGDVECIKCRRALTADPS